MSGFTFPPPPPPPPKPTHTSNQPGSWQQHSSELTYDRGRGGLRGGQRGRGQRGNLTSKFTKSQGGYDSYPQTRNTQTTQDLSTEHHGQKFSAPYKTSATHANLNSRTPYNIAWAGQNADSPPRTAAGHKRKLDALHPQNEKPNRPKPPTAPAVPGFGAAVLPSSTSIVNQRNAAPKTSTRSLGLNPATNGAPITYSDSEDDALDEESMYAELGDKLTFEHNGVVMSLKSHADLLAWKKERKKNWPTQARMLEKNEERRRIGEERRRLLNIATPLRSRQSPKGNQKNHANEGNSQTLVATPDERASRLDELRRKVLDSETKNREAKAHDKQSEAVSASPETTKATVDTTEHAVGASVGEDIVEDGILGDKVKMGHDFHQGSPSESSSESSSDSDSNSDSNSDDDAPEEASSKAPDIQPLVDRRLQCKFFSTRGHCKYGEACHFKHEASAVIQKPQPRNQQEPRATQHSIQPARSDVQGFSGRKGIFERLKEQEQEEENRLALKVIKCLGKAGFFRESFDQEGK